MTSITHSQKRTSVRSEAAFRKTRRMRDVDINLVRTELPAPGADDQVITLPIALWLSAGFWDLFGLPDRDTVLAALTFGTEDAPRTYFAGHPRDPAEWDPTPLTLDLPSASGAGPGVLQVRGAVTGSLRRMAERTGLVITFATPSDHRISGSHPAEAWEPYWWHTAVLVPRGSSGRVHRCARSRGDRVDRARESGHLP